MGLGKGGWAIPIIASSMLQLHLIFFLLDMNFNNSTIRLNFFSFFFLISFIFAKLQED